MTNLVNTLSLKVANVKHWDSLCFLSYYGGGSDLCETQADGIHYDPPYRKNKGVISLLL